MSELKARIQEDVKAAMRAKDKPRLATLRLVTAAMKQVEVDQRIELDDQATLDILVKLVKQRRDSIEQYEAANRDDLVAQERAELELIETYMPTALDESELGALLDQAVAETGAASMKDMGKVMAWLKPKVQGRAAMGALSGKVKAVGRLMTKSARRSRALPTQAMAGRIPKSFIDEVLARTDIVDIVGSYILTKGGRDHKTCARFTRKNPFVPRSARTSSSTASAAARTAQRLVVSWSTQGWILSRLSRTWRSDLGLKSRGKAVNHARITAHSTRY